ncbi:MAG: cardiolipin synthase [Pseudomonadales bacterium]
MIDILHEHSALIIGAGYLILELTAIVAAVHAVMNVRTAQGAVAWLLALVTMPFIALPLYAVFGRRRFLGYVAARRAGDAAIERSAGALAGEAEESFRAELDARSRRYLGFEKIAGAPFLRGNDVALLVDGEATFDAIFDAIGGAAGYVLVQFYIVRDDEVGRRLQDALLDCCRRGVKVYFLYDAIGSYDLPRRYVQTLRDAGARAEAFASSTGRMRRFQINFRNHRKIVVVDGRTSFVGGHNVGEEYLGGDPRLAPWRDTHVRLAGPVATVTQLPFVQDWYWTTGELPDVDWHPIACEAGHTALSLPSGPTDEVEAGALLFVHAIHSARERLWIVSPYFVPNGSIIDALKLAALRGVDVRILIAGLTDNRLVALAGRAYLPELIPSGVRVFHYANGFLHQKVMLIDDDLATVGTANLDNRSMRLNFEHTVVLADTALAAEVEAMLITDFAHSEEFDAAAAADGPWWKKAAVRGARLLAPVL